MNKGQLSAERREYLQKYILACIQDSAFTWADFKNPLFFEKLLQILSKDVRVVVNDLGKHGAAGLLQMGSMLLSKFAENVTRRK